MKPSAAIALAAILSVASHTARASELDHPETARCIKTAAERMQVSATALWLILDVERGTVGRVSQNTNGTVDIGPMQINSWWLDKVEKFGITRDDLLYNRCINIYVGAWIYAQEYARAGNVAEAIARYHSPTPRHQHRYLGLVQQAIERRARRLNRDATTPQTIAANSRSSG